MAEQRIPDDLVARMEQHFRDVAKAWWYVREDKACEWLQQVRAIVAELPEPVDPDLIEANRITDADPFRLDGFGPCIAEEWRKTAHRLTLAGIKRGRALEAEGK